MSSARGNPLAGIRPDLVRGLVSRRTMLAGLGAASFSALLAGCGTSGIAYHGSEAGKQATDRSDADKVVNWSNWPVYIDVDDKTQKRPTLEAFTKKTGIKVNYTEDYSDNDIFFAKVKPQLTANADTGRDVWCSTDWMVSRLIRLNWVQKFDRANMPNANNLVDTLVNVSFDPGRNYSIPWQSGFTGIAYNPKVTGGKKIETIDQLLTDPAIKGRVTLLTEMRDTVGLVLLGMGKDPAKFSDKDFDDAIKILTEAKNRGQLKGFTGNEYGKGLASGDIAACIAWTGDVVQLKADNPDLGYVLPSTGHMVWSDNFVIPNKARHKKNAELLIDYYYSPDVMAKVEDYVNYIPPVKGVKQVLVKSDPAVADDPLIFPSDAVQAKSHVFMGLTGEQENRFNNAFQTLIGG
ncbi:spermidine/putrescine ABC transporter substrate-binding protein [Jatrophihabitans telluris]|uniref:Spermidine/putrescine ABC transporter substrate-binding protein n=1 Tax=Jatrophihabitans telluris TaxID=2038343 RepID=A0ABY4R274_9ACTN|nr:spermidine/putrescine ABC transporter substrate-binding protein [Jatrophihabitans telluris]UQX90026.1 spermidine/putrescine ABC transporter substrate-binding protein [Jatrophihabitans telluris]